MFDFLVFSALEEETRDITDRFSNERRPEPTGLDRALGSSNYRPSQRERQNEQPKYASRSGGFVTGRAGATELWTALMISKKELSSNKFRNDLWL